MVQPGKPTFDWRRFWVAQTGVIDLSDGGFFVEPTHSYGASRTGWQISDLNDYRALVLLGEPGIGKSTTLKEEAERLRNNRDITSIHVDLRAFSTESFLYKRVFESDAFLAWKSDSANLILQLDSLDEALLRVDSIASLLADELSNYPTDRLSIRVACRTAAWPSSTLEPALSRIWGAAAVGIYELAPLSRKAVIAATEALEIDADGFFKELYAANVVPFAIKPLTLNLLLDIYKKEKKLPRSVADIYTRGCLMLCEEQSPSRRDAGRFGSYTAIQRLRIASRVAAGSMFANRYAIWTGPLGETPEEDMPLSAMAGSQEVGDFPTFAVTEAAVRETLDTGLFTSRGNNRMGWAHQGYAEFLAAEYLRAKDIEASTILKMVMHPSGGLIPQLGVVTAWIASINAVVRQKLMQLDPLVLLQGDLTGWSNADLERLTASLMTALKENRAHDFTAGPFSIGVSAFYDKLQHPTLADQLRPYISDPTLNVVTKRTAISIAKRCRLRSLQPELLALALDINADPHLRGRAIDALSECSDDTVPAKLLPIVRCELGDDPHDEMLGSALEIVWPNYVDAATLFPLLRAPNEGYFGSYVLFLTNTLPNALAAEELPAALNWAISIIGKPSDVGDFHRRSLADSIFVRAWKNLDRPDVMDRLLAYVLARFAAFHDLLGGTGLREKAAFEESLKTDSTNRRRFLATAAQRPLSDIDVYHLYRSRLLQDSDLNWLISFSPGSKGHDPTLNGETLCNLIRQVVKLDDAEQFAALYDAAKGWPALWKNFKHVFEGVPLETAEAQQARKHHEMLLDMERRTPPPIAPDPSIPIATELNKFEKGDLNAWWRLNFYLPLTPTSRGYDSSLQYAIAQMSGWLAANDLTRSRILNAAKKYLYEAGTFAEKWVGKNPQPIYHADFAAFRALLLLKEFDEVSYRHWPAPGSVDSILS
jgi:hypothetical protein